MSVLTTEFKDFYYLSISESALETPKGEFTKDQLKTFVEEMRSLSTEILSSKDLKRFKDVIDSFKATSDTSLQMFLCMIIDGCDVEDEDFLPFMLHMRHDKVLSTILREIAQITFKKS